MFLASLTPSLFLFLLLPSLSSRFSLHNPILSYHCSFPHNTLSLFHFSLPPSFNFFIDFFLLYATFLPFLRISLNFWIFFLSCSLYLSFYPLPVRSFSLFYFPLPNHFYTFFSLFWLSCPTLLSNSFPIISLYFLIVAIFLNVFSVFSLTCHPISYQQPSIFVLLII